MAYYNRGLAYSGKEDYDKAITSYTEAIWLNPNNAGYYVDRGLAYSGKKDYDRAEADFDAALRIDPDNERAKLGETLVFLHTLMRRAEAEVAGE